ncbi:MAG: ABC transporter ATP-binding protein [Parvibaculales bacterium]
MPNKTAIKLQNVSKTYMLHGSQGDQLIEVMGLKKFGLKTKTEPKKFEALKNISLDIKEGQRIGLIGRNGAGKTTLLKLVCGNFSPTVGQIEVNGNIQALMNIGIGFHPDYTGRENVKASLLYNGLDEVEYETAVEDIIDFCELGPFFDQPFKTYSLGMQSRLMFATATCIKPEILIVDEVMGAGDAYFVAKSKFRIQKLVNSGCTMLLVSHSMQQVLELCEKAIWLDNGEIVMSGEAEAVVKAYEEYMHGPIHELENKSHAELSKPEKHPFQGLQNEVDGLTLQEPYFLPNSERPEFPEFNPCKENNGFDFVSRTGLSRWGESVDLQLMAFTIANEHGRTNELTTFQPAKFFFAFKALQGGAYNCRYAIAVYDELGNCVLDVLSGKDSFTISKGEVRTVGATLNPLQLGRGEYTVSLSLHDYDQIAVFNSTQRYDLLSRSFTFSVALPDSFLPVEAKYYHSAEWGFNDK